MGICESTTVGDGTKVWAFAHVLPGARIGEDCNICDNVFIENEVVIGNRVTLKCGVQVWDGVRLGDDVFVGPNATFTNDLRPRSRQWQDRPLVTVVEDGASLGANCTILPGLTIGRGAMVGAGAVVTRNVPPNAVVVGNPARIVAYEGAAPVSALTEVEAVPHVSAGEIGVGDARILRIPSFRDLRGDLAALEFERELPFLPRRQFVVSGVTSGRVRGEHAHRECVQFLMCVSGSMDVLVDDGGRRASVRLERPDIGLLIPPRIWAAQYNFTADAVLIVLASHPYDADDYIRDYDVFQSEFGDV